MVQLIEFLWRTGERDPSHHQMIMTLCKEMLAVIPHCTQLKSVDIMLGLAPCRTSAPVRHVIGQLAKRLTVQAFREQIADITSSTVVPLGPAVFIGKDDFVFRILYRGLTQSASKERFDHICRVLVNEFINPPPTVDPPMYQSKTAEVQLESIAALVPPPSPTLSSPPSYREEDSCTPSDIAPADDLDIGMIEDVTTIPVRDDELYHFQVGVTFYTPVDIKDICWSNKSQILNKPF